MQWAVSPGHFPCPLAPPVPLIKRWGEWGGCCSRSYAHLHHPRHTDRPVRWKIHNYIKTKTKNRVRHRTRLRGGVVCVCWSVSSTLFLSLWSRVWKTTEISGFNVHCSADEILMQDLLHPLLLKSKISTAFFHLKNILRWNLQPWWWTLAVTQICVYRLSLFVNV